MNNTIAAKVLEVDPEREDEVVLLLGDQPVRCMISNCPNPIYENNTYFVSLTIQLNSDYAITETDSSTPFIENFGSGFNVIIQGKLSNSTINSVVDFDDVDIHYDHPELDGKMVKIYAERIDASFD